MTPTIRSALLGPAMWCLALLSMPGHAATTGSGRLATEMRSLPAFEAVAVAGSIDLRVRQGSTQAVQARADDNLLPLLETVVEPTPRGAVLRVRWRSDESITTHLRVTVDVVVPQLRSLTGAGAGDIGVERLDTPALQVSLAGSGNVRLVGLRTEELAVGITGSGSVEGSGRATRLKINIAGSGDVQLAELRADDVSVRISGSGNAEVQAHRTLDVSIAGSGDVGYRGDAVVRQAVQGSGSVTEKR